MSNPDNLQGWLALLEKRHTKTIDLGLQRCGEVFRRLGSPRPATTVFTVAGTNGKGSTVAYLSAFAAATGQRFGSYTSPHILEFNERICVMGTPVSDNCLVQAFEQIEHARDEVSLSYFEFTTLAGFLILSEANLNVAILEVGLGGRLDTVNLIDADCAVITPIGLDHQDYLGSDVESIAAEKAGIIRTYKPVVCSQAQPPKAILNKAAELLAPVYQRGRDFEIQANQKQLGQKQASGQSSLLFSMQGRQMLLSPPALAGQHQRDNLAAALAAFALLNPDIFEHEKAISKAIKLCRLPGRMQLMSRSPDIYVDVGHNPLAATVVASFFQDKDLADVVCVLAMLADKDAESVALTLSDVCTDWICVASRGERGQSGDDLAQRISVVLPAAQVNSSSNMDAAMHTALSVAGEHRAILVFGSFATAAAFMTWRQTEDAAKQA